MPKGWLHGPSAVAYGLMQTILVRPRTVKFDEYNHLHLKLIQDGWARVEHRDRAALTGAVRLADDSMAGYLVPTHKLRDARPELLEDQP